MKIATVLRCSFGSLVFMSGTALAATGTEVKPLGVVLFQTLLGLGVVIVAIYGLAWITKKLHAQGGGRSNDMNVLSVLPLGTKEKAILVDIAGQHILLGVAPGRVSALHVFPQNTVKNKQELEEQSFDDVCDISCDPKTPTNITALAARSTSEFSRKLHSFLGQGNRQQ